MNKGEEIACGLMIILFFSWYYAYVFFEFIVMFGPSVIRSIDTNSLFYNIVACYGMFKIIQKVPWLIFIEMFIRLHARLVIVLPLILVLSTICFILDLLHSSSVLFSYDELDLREDYGFKPSLVRAESTDVQD